MAIDEARLRELNEALASYPDPPITTPEELRRAEASRFATVFDFAQPQFRTRVLLRFSGPAVRGHDLPAATTSVIAEFVQSVRAAGASIPRTHPTDFELFVTPNVAPGSTVLELVGAPRERPSGTEELDVGDISDTPVDAALNNLFQVLEEVPAEDVDNTSVTDVSGPLGQRLYSLSRDLLRHNVDLDVTWQRPRGSSRDTAVTRAKARRLRDLLDRETVERTDRTEVGRLVSISTEGQIGVRFQTRQRPLTLSASDFDSESLRALWGGDVEVTWVEITTRHPQREATSTTHELVSIQPAPTQDLLL